MIKITEKNRRHDAYYLLEIFDDEFKIISYREIRHKYYSQVRNSVKYYIMYDNNMNPLHDVFNFVNYLCVSENSQLLALQALKALFLFQDIIHKELKDFSKTDIRNLRFFLKGVSPQGNIYEFDLKSKRSNQTVNMYLSVYRQFMVANGNDNAFIQRKIPREYSKQSTTYRREDK